MGNLVSHDATSWQGDRSKSRRWYPTYMQQEALEVGSSVVIIGLSIVSVFRSTDTRTHLPVLLRRKNSAQYQLRGALSSFWTRSARQGATSVRLYEIWVWVSERWAHKATLAPRPFSDPLCVPIYCISPAVLYLWQSTVPHITESLHSRFVP
jgi:hypothetical protein